MADVEQEAHNQSQGEQQQQPQQQEVHTSTSLQQMQAQIDQYVTDPALMAQIAKDEEDLTAEVNAENELELFKLKYDTLYEALKESYSIENQFIKQCKDHSVELTALLAKLEGVNKMTIQNEENYQITKNDLERTGQQTEDLKIQNKEIEDKIQKSKEEYVELTQKSEERIKKVEIENMKLLKDLKKAKEDIEKQCEVQEQRKKYLVDENNFIEKDVQKEESANQKYNVEVQTLHEDIKQIKEDTLVAQKKRDEMQKDIDIIKDKIIEAKTVHDQKLDILRNLKDEYEQLPLKNKDLQKEKDYHNEHNKRLDKSIKDKATELDEKKDRLEKFNENIKAYEKEIEEQVLEQKQLKKQLEEEMKTQKAMSKRLIKLKQTRDELRMERDQKFEYEKIEQQQVDMKKKERDKMKEEIDILLRARSSANKDLKKATDNDHELDGELVQWYNKTKKTENQIKGYQQENEKLRKVITQLQKEQEKYGIEASSAHAKYYQTIEEVKIKYNQITELQKKNAEVEAKLKHQQNLYEVVRSDRNLYSKNLLESQEEINELQKKYTRMTHQVDQFKEEIKQKDGQLVKEDFEFNKIVEENKTTKLQKKRVKKAIKSTEEVIKSQEGHLSRLKYVIQEAKQEKQRNSKDLDMVINERDILGTQLIKRSHELNVLYEKIKLNQSNLAKGEIFYRERQRELESLKNELTLLINELKGTQEQISCTDELQLEINSLEKDILQAKTRVKALQDELENPLNVHRWRKLEATDQDMFEKILKIQTLQRRLIAKTEEVKEKDNLIKEKEKLFMELKNILSRQPGSEIHQQLAQYKESLKEKQGQMKKMNAELKNAQESVNLLKFETQRLRDEIGNMKRNYFKKRKEQDKAAKEQQFLQQNGMGDAGASGNGIIYNQYNPEHNPDLAAGVGQYQQQENQLQLGI